MDLPRLRRKHRWRRRHPYKKPRRYRLFFKSNRISQQELDYYRALYGYYTSPVQQRTSLFFPLQVRKRLRGRFQNLSNLIFQNSLFKQDSVPLWLIKLLPVRRPKRKLNFSFEW
jgi:hypothetical protein